MAWSASGLFIATYLDQWDSTNLALDLTAEDGKLAFFDSTVTPNFTTDTAYGTAPWNAGEASGAGYTTGGPTLVNTTLTVSSGTVYFDADNITLTSSTITAEGALQYWPTKSNRAFLAVWFGGVKETQDGTFLITWNSSGIAAIDLTP